MPEKNKNYEITITGFGSNGEGIGRIDNMAVFVPGGCEGDILEIKLIKIKSSYAVGKILRILKPSEFRQESFCPASSRCGGCQLAHVAYDKQLAVKKQMVTDCLERIGGLSLNHAEVFDTLGMESPYRYRNKMVFPIGRDSGGKPVGGFYAQHSHTVVPLEDCMLGGSAASMILHTVLDFTNEYRISVYDEAAHKGLVRRVFVRFGYTSREAMAVISINGSKLPHAEQLVSRLLALSLPDYRLNSILLNCNTERNNLVLSGKNVVLYGTETIRDTLCGMEYMISPNSFFQVNPLQTERLYSKALEFAEISGTETVVDLYSGIGTISLAASRTAKNVIGVEIVPQAVADARENASLNRVTNVTFYEGSAEDISVKLAKDHLVPGVVILDPPRKGSDETTLGAILSMSPKKIVYISCNPSTLARDLKILTNGGYSLKKIQPVDMFPHTSHVEVVCLLSKLNSNKLKYINVELEMDELDLTAAESKATYEEIKDYVLEHTGLKVSNLYIAQVKQKCGIVERVNYNLPKSENSRQPKCPPGKEAAIWEALKYFRMV